MIVALHVRLPAFAMASHAAAAGLVSEYPVHCCTPHSSGACVGLALPHAGATSFAISADDDWEEMRLASVGRSGLPDAITIADDSLVMRTPWESMFIAGTPALASAKLAAAMCRWYRFRVFVRRFMPAL